MCMCAGLPLPPSMESFITKEAKYDRVIEEKTLKPKTEPSVSEYTKTSLEGDIDRWRTPNEFITPCTQDSCFLLIQVGFHMAHCQC